MKEARAFTLIELLVVISIIALLSSVVLAAVNAARTKAQIAEARREMAYFSQAVGIAQGESWKLLMNMSAQGGSTVSNCSLCVPSCSGDLRGASSTCYTNWVGVLNGVQMNSGGLVTNLLGNLNRDPWGSPYLVDENQGEGGAGACGNRDVIYSVGPDGTQGGGDDVSNPTVIPLSGKCP